VCLLGDDLRQIPWCIELARCTRRVVRWNLIWAFEYNSVGVACAAFVLLNPALAAFLAALSLVAGVLLAVQGLIALGVAPRRLWPKSAGATGLRLAGTFVGPFLTSPRLSNVLLAGVFTGFLPCGLVYGTDCNSRPRASFSRD
jgi:sulfite exporter TauE/SafE